jgi:Tfp pilus assembly protein PilO
MGVRLADATPWVIADIVAAVAVGFLISRLWAAYAPVLGRRLGRHLVWVAVPLLCVVSVVAHVVAPERAQALTEGIDSTAILVALPLAMWWVGILAFRLARRVLRGHQAPAGRSLERGAEWRRVALVLAPVVGLAILVQWGFCVDATEKLEKRGEKLKRMVRALEGTEAQADEFAHERQLLAERLEALYGITPRAPAVEELVKELSVLAADFDLSVVGWTSEPGRRDGVLQEHVVTLVLDGDVARLRDFAVRSRRMVRLINWRRASIHERRATARLSVYSALEGPPARRADICRLSRENLIWLWPYTSKVEAARAEVEELCAEHAAHAGTVAQIDDFQAKKASLEDLIQAIEKVRAEDGLPEIVNEPEESGGAPPPPPAVTGPRT